MCLSRGRDGKSADQLLVHISVALDPLLPLIYKDRISSQLEFLTSIEKQEDPTTLGLFSCMTVSVGPGSNYLFRLNEWDFSLKSSPGPLIYFSFDFVAPDWVTLYLPVPLLSLFRSKVSYITACLCLTSKFRSG